MVTQFPLTQNYVLLRDAMNQLLEDSFVPSISNRLSTGAPARSIPLDVYATPDEVVILAAVPGMDPESLDITYVQNTITFSGTLPSATESEEGKRGTWYMNELWHGDFRRTLTLPFDVDVSNAETSFENGIVRLVLPKAASARPQRIEVRVLNGHHNGSTHAIDDGSQRETTS
jgi:HSP20 family protein